MTLQVFIAIAGLMGAAGVALAAASAHAAPAQGLDSGGYFLLFHAAAVVATVVALGQGYVARPLGYLAVGGLALGASLFAGDLALRAFAGHRLFPMASPTGGVIMIASWLLLAVAALVASWR